MKVTEKDLAQIVLWAQFGTKIIQIGVGTYANIRQILAATGIPDSDMVAADAEYGRRIALAQDQQEISA